MFKANPYKKWLDALCRCVVKARDGYTCQKCDREVYGLQCHWHHIRSRKSNYLRWDLCNGITLCSVCHSEWHDGPVGAVWFAKEFPHRYEYIYSKPLHIGTWKEDDFRAIEELLIEKCIEFGVTVDNMPQAYKVRYGKAVT